ncbi:MAG: hypothetical protein R6V62_08960 [Candidatus Fermentibacteraceae bacterium]
MPARLHFLFGTLITSLLFSGCGARNGSDLNPETRYWARASFCWENLDHFQLRGRARALGESLVAEGPFVVWGTRFPPRLRGDMYSPDGRPMISFYCDTTGFLGYYPADETAFFQPGGLKAGRGILSVLSLLALVRTGFPVPPEHRVLAELYDEGVWRLQAAGDTATLAYDGGLFPSGLVIGDIEARVTRSSWHDEYQAWPGGWRVVTSSGSTEFTLSTIDVSTEPWDAIWTLRTSVTVDTLEPGTPWRLTPEPSIR